jgi:hypothetical protein
MSRRSDARYAPKSLDDGAGCEMCHGGYITFISFVTGDGNKDICSDCHLKITKARGGPSGGYPRPVRLPRNVKYS